MLPWRGKILFETSLKKMVNGHAMQAYLRLTYFSATIACLVVVLLVVFAMTTPEDEHVDTTRLQFVPLPSEIDRVALSKVGSVSVASEDFFKA